ncbi:MAG: RlmE family RNA methyltransferase [Proteobacteria bacterium]|nr:RlmE family RNA methyltransferase [Pseudomonadota bacterium]
MTRDRGHRTGRGTKVVGRGLTRRVKTAKGRKLSSTRWLQRQLNDVYVREAGRQGLRSRAAFKLMELDDRFHFLAPGKRVVDLGAAPGGWTLVAVQRVKADKGRGRVIALDANPMEPVAGATVLCRDFLDAATPAALRAALDGPADVVLSDMAMPATGHAGTDHLRITALCEAALAFATEVLAPGGVFVAKMLKGGTEHAVLADLKRLFTRVRHAKPPASRAESAETYVIAQGFRGKGRGD